jgi:hypothetical protein
MARSRCQQSGVAEGGFFSHMGAALDHRHFIALGGQEIGAANP